MLCSSVYVLAHAELWEGGLRMPSVFGQLDFPFNCTCLRAIEISLLDLFGIGIGGTHSVD